MEELVNSTADTSPPAKSNRGWFQAGDRRINREGRPCGSKAAPAAEAYHAASADRIKLLFVPARVLALRLTALKGPWVENLPRDAEIVGCQRDHARGFALTVRSATFPRIAGGTAIPEFVPAVHGQRWGRWSD